MIFLKTLDNSDFGDTNATLRQGIDASVHAACDRLSRNIQSRVNSPVVNGRPHQRLVEGA